MLRETRARDESRRREVLFHLSQSGKVGKKKKGIKKQLEEENASKKKKAPLTTSAAETRQKKRGRRRKNDESDVSAFWFPRTSVFGPPKRILERGFDLRKVENFDDVFFCPPKRREKEEEVNFGEMEKVTTKSTEEEEEESPQSDVFIAYEKQLTKSQQHQERLKRQAEASANAYRPGLRNRGEDMLPITAAKAKEMTFREAEWLKFYPVPVTRFTGKRSKDGHRRPAVILESIISKDYKRIKTESRFKRLTRLVEGINIARWGFEGIEDEEEVRITKEYYDLSQYYETKKAQREKKKKTKELARKKRKEERRRNFVPKTIVARLLAPVVDFRRPKARTHPIRFLKKEKEKEEEEEEDEEKEEEEETNKREDVILIDVVDDNNAQIPPSSSYSFADVLDTIHDWVGSNLSNLRETCQNINARKQGYIMYKIDAISTMSMPKAISEQKNIYRDFLRSLDASAVPAHGTIKMYQNLFEDAKRRAQNLLSETKIQDEWFLTNKNSRRRRVQEQKDVTLSPAYNGGDDDDDEERCIVRALVKEAIDRVVESSEALVHRITPFPRNELAANATDLVWDAETFESYVKKASLTSAFPDKKSPAVTAIVQPKITWLAKSKRSGPRTPGERGWFRCGNYFENDSQEIQQRWRHPNPEIESRPRESYDDYFSSDDSTSSSESESDDIFFREVPPRRAPPPPLTQQQAKKKNVIPKIWKGRQLAIQKFGHDEKRMWRDKIGEFLRKSRKTLGHRPLDVSWGGSVLDSVIGANLTQNVTDVLSSTAMLNLMAKFQVTEETRRKHLERVERAVRVKALVKSAIDSVIGKGRERYERECAQAASELVRRSIERIVSGETERNAVAQEDVEMQDCTDKEAEKEAVAVAEVIARMQIDDTNDAEQPSFLLCRSVPKIESSSFELDRSSMDDETDLHESSIIVEIPAMSPLEQLHYNERQMWNDFSKTPLTKRRFSEKEAWIECSNEECGKWRRIPKALADSLLSHATTSDNVDAEYLNWTCSRSFDKRHDACDKPQEMLNDDIDELVREAETLRKEDEVQKSREKKMRENKAKLREEREASKQQAASRAELNRRERREKTDKLKALAQAARDRQDFLCGDDTNENKIIVRDCVDWYRVLHEASIDDIIECIRCRGMHSMLAHRIKKILRRVLDERGVLSLEFLRDASTEEASAYLNEIEGMGAKTSACVNLLSLENRDFPVDVNVGRIMARLGWVPLEDDFKLELLEQYAPEESVYEFLSERLNTFDVTMLYELHYHMITLGKVFCAKRDPNCASCPMNSDCEYAKCGGKRRNNKINNVGQYTPASHVNKPEPSTPSPPPPPKEVVTIDLTKTQATPPQPIEDIEDIGMASPSGGSSPKMPSTPTATNNNNKNVIGRRFPSNSSMESPSSPDGFNSPTGSSDKLADVLTVEEFVQRAKARQHQEQIQKDSSEAATTAALPVGDASPLVPEPSPTAPSSSSPPVPPQNDELANNVAETMDSIIAAGKIWTNLGKPAGKKAMRVLLLFSSDDDSDSDDDNSEENKSAVAAMIMRRFKSLSKICHPDKNRNNLERASTAFGILAEAKTKAMEAVAEVDERALKDDAAFESEAEDEVLREVEDPRFAKLNNATPNAKTATAEEEAFLTPNRHNQLADLSSFTNAQFRSEVQGWRVPDECVPEELLSSLSPHPTSIIGECDDARRFCVIAAPREASDFERVYRLSTSSEEEQEQGNDTVDVCEDVVMEDADAKTIDEGVEEDVIITTPPSPPSPPSELSSIKCVFFVTALCACKRSFPLHGTYFQVNEVFLDLRSAAQPVNVDVETLRTSPKIVTLLGASIGSVTRGMTRTEVTRLFNHQVLCVRAWERRTGYPRELPRWICPVVPVASTGQEFTEFDFPSPLLHPEKVMASKAPKLGRPKKKRPAETMSIAINQEPTPPETPFNNDIFRSYLKRKSVEKEQLSAMKMKKRPKSTKSNGGNDIEQKKAKKKLNFPLIRASQKCGKCKTCLNPQMRKACLTRRAEMMTMGNANLTPSSASPVLAPTSTPVAPTATLDAFVIRSKDYEIVD